MVVNLAFDVARISAVNQRHVAIRAPSGFRRVVERPRSLTGNAACLPGVIVVESAEPAIVVNRFVEMNLVAAGTKFGRVLAMELAQEGLAVRLRVDPHEEVVHRLKDRVFAGGKLMQRRVLDHEASVPRRIFDPGDGVTRGAGESRLSLRSVDPLFDRTVEEAVEENRMVVASRAPLRRLRPDDILHVFDRLAVPLVVE